MSALRAWKSGVVLSKHEARQTSAVRRQEKTIDIRHHKDHVYYCYFTLFVYNNCFVLYNIYYVVMHIVISTVNIYFIACICMYCRYLLSHVTCWINNVL